MATFGYVGSGPFSTDTAGSACRLASRGIPRVNDRRVLNGIFWAPRSGAPGRDLPDIFGPYITCYNHFVRWRRAGVWNKIMDTPAGAHDAAVQMIDTSVVRVISTAPALLGTEDNRWAVQEVG
jgi:transposase